MTIILAGLVGGALSILVWLCEVVYEEWPSRATKHANVEAEDADPTPQGNAEAKCAAPTPEESSRLI
jgi:hypothetical protein